MSLDSRIADIARQREALIRQHGWMVQSVFPTQEMPGPSFAYTIGLHDQGVPEVLVIGLPAPVGHQLLNDVAQLLVDARKAKQPLPQGRVTHPRWPMAFYLLPTTGQAASEWATGALNRSAGQAEFLQVCWPDTHGRLPWEPRFERKFVQIQPVLGPPPAVLH